MSQATPKSEAGDVAIEVRGLSKSYSRNLRQAQRNGVSAILGEVRPRRADGQGLRQGEFWALHDVSFRIERGTALGLVGRNGAGKSTLLRLVAGISQPTRGEVVRRGTVGSLLDPNAGFNPVITGRENAEVSFALLSGQRPDAAMIDEIIAYAGIEDAIDHPVRTYSQGMRLRLGFSVMVHVDPDVLVIDEALAVGDTAFQLQCLDHLHTFCRAGGAVIFASHSLWLFQHLATEGLHLEEGTVAMLGPAEAVADEYVAALQRGSWVDSAGGPDILEREQMVRSPAVDEPSPQGPEALVDGDGAEGPVAPAVVPSSAASRRPVRFVRVLVEGDDGAVPTTGSPLLLRFELDASAPVDPAELAFTLWTADLAVCVVADATHDLGIDAEPGRDLGPGTGSERPPDQFPLPAGRSRITCRIDRLPLTPGQYAVRAAVYDGPTSDVLGLLGFEDAPTWFEVHDPAAQGHRVGSADGSRGPHRLRPLRVIRVDGRPSAAHRSPGPVAGAAGQSRE